MAGTTHIAGAAGPDDDDAEDEEAEPEDCTAGGGAEDDEAEPEGNTAGGGDDELEDPEGAPGISGGNPAAMRARAASTPEATLAFHSAVRIFLKSRPKALHSRSLMYGGRKVLLLRMLPDSSKT